jgi:hypothetical protein
MEKQSALRDCESRRRVRDEVHPEIEATGWDVFTACLGEGCGVEMVTRLSE